MHCQVYGRRRPDPLKQVGWHSHRHVQQRFCRLCFGSASRITCAWLDLLWLEVLRISKQNYLSLVVQWYASVGYKTAMRVLVNEVHSALQDKVNAALLCRGASTNAESDEKGNPSRSPPYVNCTAQVHGIRQRCVPPKQRIDRLGCMCGFCVERSKLLVSV